MAAPLLSPPEQLSFFLSLALLRNSGSESGYGAAAGPILKEPTHLLLREKESVDCGRDRASHLGKWEASLHNESNKIFFYNLELLELQLSSSSSHNMFVQ